VKEEPGAIWGKNIPDGRNSQYLPSWRHSQEARAAGQSEGEEWR
jgi:hypothetical protein